MLREAQKAHFISGVSEQLVGSPKGKTAEDKATLRGGLETRYDLQTNVSLRETAPGGRI